MGKILKMVLFAFGCKPPYNTLTMIMDFIKTIGVAVVGFLILYYRKGIINFGNQNSWFWILIIIVATPLVVLFIYDIFSVLTRFRRAVWRNTFPPYVYIIFDIFSTAICVYGGYYCFRYFGIGYWTIIWLFIVINVVVLFWTNTKKKPIKKIPISQNTNKTLKIHD